jgi:hypothetical protein
VEAHVNGDREEDYVQESITINTMLHELVHPDRNPADVIRDMKRFIRGHENRWVGRFPHRPDRDEFLRQIEQLEDEVAHPRPPPPPPRPVPIPRDPPIRIRGDYGNMRNGTYQTLVRSLGATVQPYYEIPDGSIWFPGREYQTININGHEFTPTGFIDFRADLNDRNYRLFRSRVIRFGFDSDAGARLWRAVP